MLLINCPTCLHLTDNVTKVIKMGYFVKFNLVLQLVFHPVYTLAHPGLPCSNLVSFKGDRCLPRAAISYLIVDRQHGVR